MNDALARLRAWIERLPQDARAVRAVAEDARAPLAARRIAMGTVSYLLQQVDLLPDWLPVIGILDDAFVLRIGMAQALDDGAELSPEGIRLANEAESVEAFVGPDLYEKLRAYVSTLASREIKRRTPDRLLESPELRKELDIEIENVLRARRSSKIIDVDAVRGDLVAYLTAKLR